jgi:hypothetical protein
LRVVVGCSFTALRRLLNSRTSVAGQRSPPPSPSTTLTFPHFTRSRWLNPLRPKARAKPFLPLALPLPSPPSLPPPLPPPPLPIPTRTATRPPPPPDAVPPPLPPPNNLPSSCASTLLPSAPLFPLLNDELVRAHFALHERRKYAPPEGFKAVRVQETHEGLDWDAINEDKELELWAVRVPAGVRLPSLFLSVRETVLTRRRRRTAQSQVPRQTYSHPPSFRRHFPLSTRRNPSRKEQDRLQRLPRSRCCFVLLLFVVVEAET